MRIGIIDYGVGNLGSMLRVLDRFDISSTLISRPVDIRSVDKLILPGVGNFSDCMRLLVVDNWVGALNDEVLGNKRPLLGVCVGMQLLADSSQEGAEDGCSIPGLGYIPGSVKHLRTLGSGLRVPHVGWNNIAHVNNVDALFSGIPDGTDFYFVHSYAFVPQNSSNIIAITDYGVPFPASVRHGHIWGTQFHPEKSSRAGIRLLQNFIEVESC